MQALYHDKNENYIIHSPAITLNDTDPDNTKTIYDEILFSYGVKSLPSYHAVYGDRYLKSLELIHKHLHLLGE